MRLLGRRWQESLTGAYGEPPAMPVGPLFYNLITVVSLISKQIFRIYSFDKMFCLAAISSGTFSDKYSDRHTMRIHGQMYLGVEPPFVRAIA